MILVHTTVMKLLDRDLVESHWWFDDLHLVTFPRDQLRNEQHIGEEEAVDVHLAGNDQATVSVENTRAGTLACVQSSDMHACLCTGCMLHTHSFLYKVNTYSCTNTYERFTIHTHASTCPTTTDLHTHAWTQRHVFFSYIFFCQVIS